MGTDDDSGHFGEGPQRGFNLSPESAVEFHCFGLRVYNFRCAISGEQFLPDTIPHPHLEVVLIRPAALGGQAEFGNVIVLEEHVARAFRRGIVQVSDDLEVVVPDRAKLEPRLARNVVAGHPLFLPDDLLFWPHREAFSFHRALFDGGPAKGG